MADKISRIGVRAEVQIPGVTQNAEAYNKALAGMQQATQQAAQNLGQSMNQAAPQMQKSFTGILGAVKQFATNMRTYYTQFGKDWREALIYSWNTAKGREEKFRAIGPAATIMGGGAGGATAGTGGVGGDFYQQDYNKFYEESMEERANIGSKARAKEEKEEKGFATRLTTEITKMGVLRGGLFWRFARAAGGPMLAFAASVWIAQKAIEGINKVITAMFKNMAAYDAELAQLTGFQTLATGYNISAVGITRAMREASNATVSNTKIMAVATKELLSGHEELAAQMPKLMERAMGWAPMLNQTVEQTFDQVVASIKGGSAEALEQFGLLKVGTDALDAYCDEWNTTTDAMSSSEKEAVLLNAVLSELPRTMTDVSLTVDSTTDSWNRMMGAIKKVMGLSLQQLYRPVVEGALQWAFGKDIIDAAEAQVAMQGIYDSWMRTRDAISKEVPSWDWSPIQQQLDNIGTAIRAAASQAAPDWEYINQLIQDYGDLAATAQEQANLEYMVQQVGDLATEISNMFGPTSEEAAQANVLAQQLWSIVAAARSLDPTALREVEAILKRMATIAGVVGMPGFAKETEIERNIRVQGELDRMQDNYMKRAEQWALQVAEYIRDPRQVKDLLAKYQAEIDKGIEAGMASWSEFERELYLQRIGEPFENLLENLQQADKDTKQSTSDLKEYNNYLILTNKNAGNWAAAFAQAHGGQTPMEAYARHEEPLVAAAIDKMWGDKFAADKGRPPTDAEWQAHWYEQWAPLEAYKGGPIGKATGPLADLARAQLDAQGLGGIDDVFHDAWMEAHDLAPKLKGVMTQAEALTTFSKENVIPSMDTFNTELGNTTAALIKAREDLAKPPPTPPPPTPPTTVTPPGPPIFGGILPMQSGGITQTEMIALLHPNEAVVPLEEFGQHWRANFGGGDGGGDSDAGLGKLSDAAGNLTDDFWNMHNLLEIDLLTTIGILNDRVGGLIVLLTDSLFPGLDDVTGAAFAAAVPLQAIADMFRLPPADETVPPADQVAPPPIIPGIDYYRGLFRGAQTGGLTLSEGPLWLHPNELILPLSHLMNTVNMRMATGGASGGINIGNLNVPVTIGSGAGPGVASDVQAAVVNAIRGRAGTEMMRAARRLGY